MAPIGFALLALGLDDRPVVGILTLPSIEGLPTNHTYLPASYVKWMESAGARVAPVRFDAPRDELRALADSLNGLVFTGGSNDIFDPDSGKPTPYFDTALFLYNIAAAKDPNALWFRAWLFAVRVVCPIAVLLVFAGAVWPDFVASMMPNRSD